MQTNRLKSLPALAGGVALTLAVSGLWAEARQHAEAPKVTKAIAVLKPTEGHKAHGTITFTHESGGVHVKGTVEGLTPGEHGFHIHEFGDISSADGKSAGGHFNPKMEKHAGPDAKMRHVGDLGNIKANGQGVATIDHVDTMLSFHGESSILGRGLIVHEKADDLKTQPTGDAGGRVASAVIGVAKGE